VVVLNATVVIDFAILKRTSQHYTVNTVHMTYVHHVAGLMY